MGLFRPRRRAALNGTTAAARREELETIINLRGLTGGVDLPVFEVDGKIHRSDGSAFVNEEGQRFTPLTSIVASAVRRSVETKKGGGPKKSRGSGWQAEAWELYDQLGEITAPASQFANAASRAVLYLGRAPVDDTDLPEPLRADAPDLSDDDRKMLDIWRSFGGIQSQRSQILRRLTEQLWVVGESYLVGLVPEGMKDQDEVPLSALRWEVVSPDEMDRLEDTGSGFRGQDDIVLLDDKGQKVDTPRISVRVWRPHPRRWWEANSPVRSSRPVLRELVQLGKFVSAQVDSRLAGAGILAMTEGAMVVTSSEEEEEAFVDAFMEMILEPIENRDSAASLVPNLVTVKGEDASKAMHHITFATELDKEVRNLRDEAIRRWALAADLPADQLLGEATGSHWAAWLSMEDTVRTHIEPMLVLEVDAITTQYLWPVAAEAGVENPQDYVVWYDAGPLTERPHRTDVALELHDRRLLSDAAVRAEARYSEDDAPESGSIRDNAIDITLDLVGKAPSLAPQLSELVDQIERLLWSAENAADRVPAPAAPSDPLLAPEDVLDLPEEPGSERPSADGPGGPDPSSSPTGDAPSGEAT